MGTTPYTAAPVSWWLNLGLQQTAGSGLWRAEQEDAEPLRVHSQYGVYPGEDSLLSLQDQDGQAKWILASGPDAQRAGTTGLHHPSGEGIQVESHAIRRG